METKNKTTAKGLRLLRNGNILSVISVVVGIVGAIALLVGAGVGVGLAAESGGTVIPAGAVGVAGIGGITALIGLILSFVAGVMQIVALAKNSAANAGYKTALMLVFANIVAGFAVSYVATMNTMPAIVTTVISAIPMILSFFVVYFVINATAVLLEEKGDAVATAEGISVRKLYIICTSIMVIGSLVGLVPMLTGVVDTISLVTSVVQLVALFKYIGFLGHAATALEV